MHGVDCVWAQWIIAHSIYVVVAACVKESGEGQVVGIHNSVYHRVAFHCVRIYGKKCNILTHFFFVHYHYLHFVYLNATILSTRKR